MTDDASEMGESTAIADMAMADMAEAEENAEEQVEAVGIGSVTPRGREGLRARVWTLYLRGWSYTAIGRELALDRETVSRMVRRTYSELGRDRREALEGALEEAVARLRHIQTQAWVDHDVDDERERAVLALALGEARSERGKAAPGRGKRGAIERGEAPVGRFVSQRAHYLRVALDCEREIARLRGLYGAALPLDEGAQIVFRIERVEADLTPRRPLPVGEGKAQAVVLPEPEEEG